MGALAGDRRLRGVLLASSMALFALNLDFFAVQSALPQMADDLATDVTSLQWVLSGFLIALSSFLVVGGRLGDLQGRRRWLLIGAAVFGGASLVGGAATSAEMVIGARIVQGLGAAVLFPVCLAVVTNAFPSEQTQRAVGLVFGISAVGIALGPFLGGALTGLLSWRWVLWVNVPVTAVVALLAVTSVEESRDEDASRHLDWLGLVLVVASMATFSYGVDTAAERGWTAPATLALIGIGLVGLIAFVLVEERVHEPLVDLSLFAIPRFALMTAAGVVGNMGIVTAIFLSMLYLQDVEGLSALAAGTAFLLFSLGMTASQQLSGRLERVPAWAVMGAALAVGGLGGLGMGLAVGDEALFLLCSVAAGAGYGMCWAYVSVITQDLAPAAKAGAASGVVLTVILGIGAVAVAVASSVVTTRGGSDPAGLEDAVGEVLATVGVVAVVLAPVLVLLARRGRRRGDVLAAS